MNRLLGFCTSFIGLVCFAIVLAFYNIADGDLWARLAVGACFWNTGSLWFHDVFAFTQTLPHWIDHEWGAGVLYFYILKISGSTGLMVAKIVLGLSALALPLYVARRQGAMMSSVLFIAIPAAWTILPGYGLVIRSHALTYVLFGLTLLIMQIGATRPRWFWLLPFVMLFWANVHGGFVTGFAVMACYGIRFWDVDRPSQWRLFFVTALLSCVGVSLINPYGIDFWSYLLSALLHPRPRIVEWAPMPFWGWDVFTGYRVFFVLAVIILIAGWRQTDSRARWRSLPGLLLLMLTATAAWQHCRHAPFFSIAACAVLPAYLDAALAPLIARFSNRMHYVRVMNLAVFLLYAVVAGVTFNIVLPLASLNVLAPVGFYPVRECDILSRSGISGNVVVPFDWGSYAAWRLYPKVKVSIDGRYEETYPESTFEMNVRFFNKEGSDWSKLVQDNVVNFVMVDKRHTNLVESDLVNLGFVRVWSSFPSELWARPEMVPLLQQTVESLPEVTIQPLDAAIVNSWPWPSIAKP